MINKRLHILFLSSWYPSRVIPLNGNFVQNHARCLSKLCDITVLHLITDPSITEVKIDIKEDIIRECIVYMPPKKGVIRLYCFIKMYFNGFKFISEKYGKPNLLHLNITYPVGLVAVLFNIVYRIPYIITEHWSKFNNKKEDLSLVFRLITGLVVKNAFAVCPVSQKLAINMQQLGLYNSNYQVIGNVVDVSIFENINRTVDKDSKRITHISNLNEQFKNPAGLMRVFFKLCEMRNDIIINIVSDGNMQKWIDMAIKNGFYNNKMFFKGPFNQIEVANELSNSDLFVLFSDSENLPCVIIESFACGVPVASTNVGGIPEMVDNSRGILVNKGDEQAMIESIDYMLDNIEQYNSESIRQYAIDNFSVEAISAKYYQLYCNALHINA